MRGGAIHAHMSNALAAATRRRRAPAAAWTHTGTHYLSSDGLAGSYADAATTAAARVVFGGTGAPTFTVAMWVRSSSVDTGVLGQVSDDSAPRATLLSYGDTTPFDSADVDIAPASGVADSINGFYVLSGGVAWDHVALVCDGATAELIVNGVSAGTMSLPSPPYATVDAFTLFADYAHALRLAGDIRDPAVWGRALSAAEVAALHTAGAGHDLREDVGAYTGGGPEHWWPADGDSGTTVTDRGSVGTCPLTLHGGVTIEEA